MTKKNSNSKTSSRQGAAPAVPRRIHPVIIYPFRPVDDYTDLTELYSLVARLDSERARYARPLTVMDRKTFHALQGDPRFQAFRQGTVARHSDIVDAWCVDTCQMWYTGLGEAFARGAADDIYWLIPGDFNYGASLGQEVLRTIHDLPEIIEELNQDLCVGEIASAPTDSKQLIDTYGTFALLYTWFPEEAEQIRNITSRPRSEFFAIRHGFLQEALTQRWYAYEQTLILLLLGVGAARRISRFSVGDITDLPHGRDSLDSAVQQIERTERVLKMMWRERHRQTPGWFDRYRALEIQSAEVRRSAGGILRSLLPA
jgi:hypothetical protein